MKELITNKCLFFAVHGGKLHAVERDNLNPYILTSCGMLILRSSGTVIKTKTPVHNHPCRRCFKEYNYEKENEHN